jgi:hypothetical protein
MEKELKEKLKLNKKEYNQLITNELKECLENDDITVELKNTSWIKFNHKYLDYTECKTSKQLIDYTLKKLNLWHELEFALYDINLEPTNNYRLFNLKQAFKTIENKIKDYPRIAENYIEFMQEYEPLRLDHLIAKVKAVV